ncbi:MAG: hypothetical protein JJ871_06495 [Thalassospira sp.]|uniref:hypothetical protein n=1 Tax=Thalassospira sp. TaxID=1912094 RepID=UPI001B0FB069|nr:hypothetical protein [Thalassospira sp.]MBO6580724.1 hypothetical protein [Thalassospira sp.]MBO6801746.1 hypothetical protein [Thalassospira sp.]MBO6818765.1 hypothetical protein [Thalassospira sp.]MBO6887699.1 hypothetical protein [Thalassospira sp.]
MNDEELKTWLCSQMAAIEDEQTIRERLRKLVSLSEITDNGLEKSRLADQIQMLEEHLEEAPLRTLDQPQGIDELMLGLVQYRAMVFAFEKVKSENSPFDKLPFFKMWIVSTGYLVATIIGKLTNKDNRDNSLKSAWKKCNQAIKESGVISTAEWKKLDNLMRTNTYFSNESSKAIRFRNKTIAHNEATFIPSWSDLDNDIKILARVWSVLSIWCAFPQPSPFNDSKQMFSGLEAFFNTNEFDQLSKHYEHYVSEFCEWCRTSLVAGEPQTRSPFLSLKVTIKHYPNRV